MKIQNFYFITNKLLKYNKFFVGVGGWGVGDGGLAPIPTPQSPIPNPQSPFKIFYFYNYYINYIKLNKKNFYSIKLNIKNYLYIYIFINDFIILN